MNTVDFTVSRKEKQSLVLLGVFLGFFSEKTSLDISCESSAKWTIHMKCQDLFSLKKRIIIKNDKKKLSSAAVVTGALWVNYTFMTLC